MQTYYHCEQFYGIDNISLRSLFIKKVDNNDK